MGNFGGILGCFGLGCVVEVLGVVLIGFGVNCGELVFGLRVLGFVLDFDFVRVFWFWCGGLLFFCCEFEFPFVVDVGVICFLIFRWLVWGWLWFSFLVICLCYCLWAIVGFA